MTDTGNPAAERLRVAFDTIRPAVPHLVASIEQAVAEVIYHERRATVEREALRKLVGALDDAPITWSENKALDKVHEEARAILDATASEEEARHG